ncbi:3-oxoacyl-[acyl-carrier-protein] synthase-1 [Methylobacter tundripaludum]|uniref:3-oxoacyl-[acyl-carrier-protein] synthase-1 n=1 Tax=Methylobacter tundripaludum TaxID=173365 RepID=A0A2S6H9C3_9GAMM|nr:beta-ketoacyl-ACP synthase [Methylobacter tundripaludum]PPK74058.1 3-oxoacyl-[acyl-carrier-protein] synthase-1 [Methylobacter tundripaludum]
MTLYLNDLGLLCALGNSKAEVLKRLLAGDRSGLVASDEFGTRCIVGAVAADLPEIPPFPPFFKGGRVLLDNKGASAEDCSLSSPFEKGGPGGIYNCRNNRLLLAAVSQIEQTVSDMMARFGADRIGIVLGTSTSGVRNTELALDYWAENGVLPDQFHYKQQQMGAGADFLADFLGVQGPAYTISTACSSSGKAFASARRLIRQGLCDAVIVGGADSLCGLTVNGFTALESISSGLCKPFGIHRDGINIGEAVSLFVLSAEPGPVVLRGIGATSDAYHFAAPDPEATDVIRAMQNALDDAGKTPGEIDYLNLHGTATVLNDAMESKAVNAVFGSKLAASSSKGMTGHTLGAAAALELAFCWLLLTHDDEQGALIPNINDDEPDTALSALNLVKKGEVLGRRINTCQSNSFAFGGNNLSIVVERA